MNCKICSSSFTTELYRTHTKCNSCHTIFQNNSKISVSYDKDYVEQYDVYHTTRMMSLLRAGLVSGVAQTYNRTILDVGYGNGDFLKVMRMNGWDIAGTDLFDSKNNIPHLSFEKACKKEWGVVTFFDSLEHFPNPKIVRKLSVEYIVVSVPNYPQSIWPDKRDWKHWKPGEHLFHYKQAGLEKLFPEYRLISRTSCEDIIRGKLTEEDNIVTYIFKKEYDI